MKMTSDEFIGRGVCMSKILKLLFVVADAGWKVGRDAVYLRLSLFGPTEHIKQVIRQADRCGLTRSFDYPNEYETAVSLTQKGWDVLTSGSAMIQSWTPYQTAKGKDR